MSEEVTQAGNAKNRLQLISLYSVKVEQWMDVGGGGGGTAL